MLAQLSLLRGAADVVVSVGPPPAECLVRVDASVHLPLGSRRLGGWRMSDHAPQAARLHAWSADAAAAAEVVALNRNLPMLYSLPACPARAAEQAAVVDLVNRQICVATVPTASAAQALHRGGAAAEGVAVLPPPVATFDDLPQRRPAVRTALGLAEGDFLLVCPDEMTEDSGHIYGPWVHAVLRQIVPHVRLLMPGDGPARRRSEFFASSTGYEGEIFMTGQRLGLADCLAAADAAVFFHVRDCGVYHLLAAIAAGLPVAAAATPDIAEVTQGADVILTEPDVPRSASAAGLKLLDRPRSSAGSLQKYSIELSRQRLCAICQGLDQPGV